VTYIFILRAGSYKVLGTWNSSLSNIDKLSGKDVFLILYLETDSHSVWFSLLPLATGL